MTEEYDPFFCFAHDFGAHRYDCGILLGAFGPGECTCGFSKAFAEAEAFVARLSAAEQEHASVREDWRRAVAAQAEFEARADAALEALRLVDVWLERRTSYGPSNRREDCVTRARDIARAALAGREEPGGG